MFKAARFKAFGLKATRAFTRVGLTLLLVSAVFACETKTNNLTVALNFKDSLPPVESLEVGEGFVNPIGYYESEPRFSWIIPNSWHSNFQSAYQLQVATNSEFSHNKLVWDSEKVLSNETSWVRYQGAPLQSRTKLFWRVRAWDEYDIASIWSEPQTIEIGLLNNADWQAQWIGHPDTALDKQPSHALIATPQYFRKSFDVTDDIKQARLYITAKGLFKPHINGLEVSPNDVMTPGWTPYDKRLESLTYDVTTLLQSGRNTLATILAGGWYSGRVFGQFESDHRKPPRFLAQLEITYGNGTTQTIVTDSTWKSTQQGPIRFASIYDGERYDQNLEMSDWAVSSFDDEPWQPVVTEALDSSAAIRPKRHAPIRIVEEMPVKSIVSHKNNTVIFDFGQNMVGVPRIRVPVVAGKEIRVRVAEALHKGEFYTENYRSAKSENRYVAAETGTVEYAPTFTYHGYRYVEVSGFDSRQAPEKNWVTALIQHSDVGLHASFTSSHNKLNKLAENIVWGLRSNFYDIPLDCPQRDERLGWTGDAQVFVTPSMYMADVYGFWSAWLQSVREDQREDGAIPLYVPDAKWKIDWASSGWGDAATIIPWQLYIATGDKSILADNYDMMKQWLEHHKLKSKNYISNMNTFGDWLQPYPVINVEGDNGNRGNTDFNLIGTAYFAYSVNLTIKAAEVLGQTEDLAALNDLHGNIQQSLLETFFDQDLNLKKGIPTQTTYLLGLGYDLFPEEKRDLAVEKLIELLRDADFHLRTGFLGTPLLSEVLQEAGRSDVMYDLLFKETYPSWFYSINNGATTTWERWNSYSLEDGFNPQGMNSLNHYAYGTVSRWFYEGILGITPIEPGFKKIRIEPQFTAKLSRASGGYKTPNGEVRVDWNIFENQLTMKVTIPKNTTADVILAQADYDGLLLNGVGVKPSGIESLPAGNYTIVSTVSL